ncbi:MAG: type II toxin-antitoxin system death-on-curing family toxin [Candidatus Omnitrophica bacterium]|nr:type II toxin-antitoxin system death-on-curing family toxin [Candidatus Omnitrophota bacterium]
MEETGGSPGLRDEGLLRSALARPKATFGAEDLYPAIFEKAGALLESLVRNHPFLDGNKRMAWECFDLFLEINGYRITASRQQGYALMMQIIERQVTVQDVADWLKKHTHHL